VHVYQTGLQVFLQRQYLEGYVMIGVLISNTGLPENIMHHPIIAKEIKVKCM
jgi:hypothetical protein